MKELRFKYSICFLYLSLFVIQAQTITPRYLGFPTPPPNEDMLFYLQRTVDYNTVIYEVNYNKNGKIDEKKPVNIYWIDYERDGKVSMLTFAQNKFAYGITSKIKDKEAGVIEIKLVSYKKVSLYLKPTAKKNRYETHVRIKGRNAILTKIFVNIIGGSYLNPDVKHIELTGKDILTGEVISEILLP